MTLSSLLFGRSVDKFYLASLVTCLIYISTFERTSKTSDQLHPHVDLANISNIPHLDFLGFENSSPVQSKGKGGIKALFTAQQDPWAPPGVADLDESRLEMVPPYINAIMDSQDEHFDRLRCPAPGQPRYESLRRPSDLIEKPGKILPRYFFALNLYQCVHVLPRLLGSVIQAMRFLDPEDCVLSIVGGRSDDGTTEILDSLRHEVEALGATYYFSTSDIDPMRPGHDRVAELANLRNLALHPLVRRPEAHALDAVVVFLNDVSICADDILELLHQRVFQAADMVCALDWVGDGSLFYDVWISRMINGDLFFEIPQSGSWDFAGNLFWNEPATRARFDARLPFQVYSCWNGAVAFAAEPLIRQGVRFRASYSEECYMGEPTLFCKDFWAQGYGRIAVIPSVNVGYNDDQSRHVKTIHGYASSEPDLEHGEMHDQIRINWKPTPPELVKCEPDWNHPSWVEWDQAEDRVTHDWSDSGYFNAKKVESDIDGDDSDEQSDVERGPAPIESKEDNDGQREGET